MIKRSLTQLESRLPEKYFIRINRQNIANVKHIDSLELIESGAVLVNIKSGNATIQLEMSRRQFQRVKDLMSI